MVTTPISVVTPTIEWVKPPDNFVLDGKPAQNNGQPPHWLRWWDVEGNRLPWAIETA
jgi:hypothetical protein